jgi:hypothetical protein
MAPAMTTAWCTDLWQLRSSNTVSPGRSKVISMALFEVVEPLVI